MTMAHTKPTAEKEVGGRGLAAHQRDVAVVPGVVVHQRGPVGHAGDLVAVVPPRHDAGVLVGVLPQPVVGLPEVIQDVPRPGGRKLNHTKKKKKRENGG